MQIVINIDEEVYNFTIQRGHLPYGVNIAGSIIDGKVLPKGHGDLIDKDHFEKLLRDYGLDYEADTFIPMATTVIKADKGET